MEIKIVLGHAFGDEGKGVTVQYLCKKAINEGKNPLVIRFSGGPQAAHTIQNNGITHICSSFGAGVLLGVPTYIAPSAYFDPISALSEWKELMDKTNGNVPPLYVDAHTQVITPYDVFAGRNDAKVIKDGTCGKGIFPTFKRTSTEIESPIMEVLSPKREVNHPLGILHKVRDYYNAQTDKDIEHKFANAVNCNFYNVVCGDIVSFYDVLIFEGSQGLLLDMESGFYPNVTPSKVGLNGIPTNFLENAELYLVTRTYLTRHGNGYQPYTRGFNFDLSNKFETNVLNQYQGKFKVGIIDFDLLKTAINRAHIDNYIEMYHMHPNLVVTHFDLLDQGSTFKFYNKGICEEFQYDSKKVIGSLFRGLSSIDYENIYINESPESNLLLYENLTN